MTSIVACRELIGRRFMTGYYSYCYLQPKQLAGNAPWKELIAGISPDHCIISERVILGDYHNDMFSDT